MGVRKLGKHPTNLYLSLPLLYTKRKEKVGSAKLNLTNSRVFYVISLKENKNSHSSYFQNSIGYQKSNFPYSESRKKVTNGDDFPIDILHLESTTKVSFNLFITL